MWAKIRPILTILTNILLAGRTKGLWTEKDGIPKK